MSLTKNIGIGKELFYNPFYHYRGNSNKWLEQMFDYGIFPKELLGEHIKWELKGIFEEIDLIIIHIIGLGRNVPVYIYIDEKCIEISVY